MVAMRLASDVAPEFVDVSLSAMLLVGCRSGTRSASLPSPAPTPAPVRNTRLGAPIADELFTMIRSSAMKVASTPQRVVVV
jgi:hypothetical protein